MELGRECDGISHYIFRSLATAPLRPLFSSRTITQGVVGKTMGASLCSASFTVASKSLEPGDVRQLVSQHSRDDALLVHSSEHVSAPHGAATWRDRPSNYKH